MMQQDRQQSITRKMREDFHISIRRQKKNQYFKKKREQLKEAILISQQQQMTQILDTPQKKQEWISNKALELTGIPNENWKIHINQMINSLLCYQKNFKSWIELGIIKSLCTAFYWDYYDIRLGAYVAKILGNIIYCQQDDQQAKTSLVAIQILQQQVLSNICELALQKDLSNSEVVNYMILIGNLAVNDRKKVIVSGGLNVFIQWSNRILQQKQINRANLDIIYEFFNTIVEKVPEKYSLPYNTVIIFAISFQASSILKVLNEFIKIDQSATLTYNLLLVLCQIAAYHKQAIYSSFFSYRSMIRRLFELCIHDKEGVRYLAWRTLSFLSSSNQPIYEIFQENNIYEVIVHAYQKEVTDTDKFDKITSAIIICITNLVEEGDYVKQKILNGKVIDVILDSVHPTRSTSLKFQGFYCLISIVLTQNYELYRKIVFDYPILEKLVLGLQFMQPNTVSDILKGIYHLIIMQHRAYKLEGNAVICILESKYKFLQLISQIQKKFSKHALIIDQINKILDLWTIM